MKSSAHREIQRDIEIGVKHWLNTSDNDPCDLVVKTGEGGTGEKGVLVPRRTCGEIGYACAFRLCACGCFACFDHCAHYAQKTCCSGASPGLFPCRCRHGCLPHRPYPHLVFPERPASGSNCGSPGIACSQQKINQDTQIKNKDWKS